MSANIIDSLVVELGIDSKKFMRGLSDAAGAMNGAKRALLEFAAAAGGAAFLVSMTEKVTQLNADLGLFTHNLDISIEKTNSWGNAVRAFGGSAQGFQGTIAGLTMEFEKLQLTGDSSLLPILNKFADLDRTDPFKFLEGLKEKIDYINDPRQSKMLLDMLHIDTGTQNMMLNTTAEKFSALIAEQQRKNQVDKESAKASQELREKYVSFQTSLEAIYTKFVNEISPGLTKGFEYITESISYLVGHKEAIEAFFGVIALAIAGATLPMIAGVAPVLILAGAIALLYEDFQNWREGAGHFIDWDSWKMELEGAVAQIGNMIFKIKDLYKTLRESDLQVVFIAVEKIVENIANLLERSVKGWKMIFEFIGDALGIHPNTPESVEADKAELAKNFKGDSKNPKAKQYQQETYQFLRGEMGLTDAQAAGIMGNILGESGFNPDVYGDGGEALGLMQWHPKRRAAYEKANNLGYKVSDLRGDAAFREQLKMMKWERENSEKPGWDKALGNGNSPESVAAGFALYVERMADTVGAPKVRGKMARDLFNKINASPDKAIPSIDPSLMNMYSRLGAQNLAAINAIPDEQLKAQNTSSSNEISIGQISIQTNATDAQGIAKDIGREIINIADTGMCY